MALGIHFMHILRLSVIPMIYYKIRQVQGSAPHHGEEEYEPDAGK